jgi:hypothetical protein
MTQFPGRATAREGNWSAECGRIIEKPGEAILVMRKVSNPVVMAWFLERDITY